MKDLMADEAFDTGSNTGRSLGADSAQPEGRPIFWFAGRILEIKDLRETGRGSEISLHTLAVQGDHANEDGRMHGGLLEDNKQAKKGCYHTCERENATCRRFSP